MNERLRRVMGADLASLFPPGTPEEDVHTPAALLPKMLSAMAAPSALFADQTNAENLLALIEVRARKRKAPSPPCAQQPPAEEWNPLSPCAVPPPG